MEIRLHGRGGQGGVTCAKILAAIYARMGKSVQTFGDYAGERSGAPVRAYTRVSDQAITNRNKVYEPDHLLVLDPTLLSDEVVQGLAAGGVLLVNSPESPATLAERFQGCRVATVDATEIARRHGIGSRTVVIVNTTIAGAFARAMGLSFEVVETAYEKLGYSSNLAAAREAYEAVQFVSDLAAARAQLPSGGNGQRGAVLDLVAHTEGAPTGLKTGSWRSQMPRYIRPLAPCSARCPAGNDVVGFVQALARDGEEAAARVLGRTTPFAAVCGRVCPGFCMDGCNRAELDGRVNTRALERWVADHVSVALSERATPRQVRRLAVVGGGPAGLSAAYHLARAGHAVTVFDSEPELGGVLRTGIPSYRLPREVLDREIQGVLDLGVEARCGEVLDADRVDRLRGEFDAVVLATGLQRLQRLEVPGAELDGIEQGLRFLHRVNFGARDAAAVRGHVVVLGGGNTAMDCARSALRVGAGRVTVAYRRTRAEMPAIADEVHEAEQEGVEFAFLAAPVGFVGVGGVSAIALAEVELGEPDGSGRRRPVVTERVRELACDVVLLALGQSADHGLLRAGWKLVGGRAWDGEAALDIFATGDVATNEGTVAHAIGDGRRIAALALVELGEAVEVPALPDVAQAVSLSQMRAEHFAPLEPTPVYEQAAEARRSTFEEVNGGLFDASEAARCLSCGDCTECDTCLVFCPEGIIARKDGGGYLIDYDFCKGCGVCVAECPRRGMEMVTA